MNTLIKTKNDKFDTLFKQGQDTRGRAAPPHPGRYQVPPGI